MVNYGHIKIATCSTGVILCRPQSGPRQY